MLPFLSHTFINNFSSSIDLYFQSFEFNASIYYIFRQIGYWITGYNQIGLIGKITPIIVVAITLYISFKNINLKKFSENKITFDFEGFIKKAGFILFCYYIFSSIVHPWYLINLVFISIFALSSVAFVVLTLIISSFFVSIFLFRFVKPR